MVENYLRVIEKKNKTENRTIIDEYKIILERK